MIVRQLASYHSDRWATSRSDIDYMHGYRNFDNDPYRYPYPEGKEFLGKLHEGGRHYIPIVDSALYIPNPQNESDA